MKKYDLGSSFYIEVEFWKYPPFGTSALADPDIYKITIKDPNNTKKVDAEDLTRDAVGQYYYLVESKTDWITGDYKVTINSTEDSVDDVTVSMPEFQLV